MDSLCDSTIFWSSLATKRQGYVARPDRRWESEVTSQRCVKDKKSLRQYITTLHHIMQ